MKLMTALLALAFATVSFADTTIGIVDIQKVIVTIKEGKKVIGELEKAFNDKKAILKKEEDKIKKAQEDYQKQGAVLSDAARMKKERELQESIMKLQNQTGEYQKDIQNLENNLKKPILDKLKDVIDEVSVKSAVDMTFEAGTSPVIYAKSRKELTDDVIKAYDTKHPGK